MTSTRLILAGLAGLLAAAVLIGGVNLYGGAAVHIDLLQGGSIAVADRGPNSPGTTALASLAPNSSVSSSSTSFVTAQTPEGTAVLSGGGASSPVPPTVSSVDTLTSEQGPSLVLLLLPVAVGAILGLVFYRLYTSRIEAG